MPALPKRGADTVPRDWSRASSPGASSGRFVRVCNVRTVPARRRSESSCTSGRRRTRQRAPALAGRFSRRARERSSSGTTTRCAAPRPGSSSARCSARGWTPGVTRGVRDLRRGLRGAAAGRDPGGAQGGPLRSPSGHAAERDPHECGHGGDRSAAHPRRDRRRGPGAARAPAIAPGHGGRGGTRRGHDARGRVRPAHTPRALHLVRALRAARRHRARVRRLPVGRVPGRRRSACVGLARPLPGVGGALCARGVHPGQARGEPRVRTGPGACAGGRARGARFPWWSCGAPTPGPWWPFSSC